MPLSGLPMESLVVTIVGPDRPGLVSLVSDCGRAHGASWEESRMASLAGQFAGIVHFAVPLEQKAALTAALQALRTRGLEAVVVAGVAEPAASTGRVLRLELVGQDRPGIIRDISGAIADLGVSIRDLTTELLSAAMSGEHLFSARAVLFVPGTVRSVELRRVLEGLANELMVDLVLDEGQGA